MPSDTSRRSFLAALCGCAIPHPALAFDWNYATSRFDLTPEAVLGTLDDFQGWATKPRGYLAPKFQAAIPARPQLISRQIAEQREAYVIEHVTFSFPAICRDGANLDYTVSLALPREAGTGRRLALAINGHGEVGGEGRGQAPVGMFKPGQYGDALTTSGYVVAAFPNTIHERIAQLAEATDYSVLWARLADMTLDLLMPTLPVSGPVAAIGNAAGGLTALILATQRADIGALATNGAFFSLEQTRREYRIYAHPFCHDFRAFFAYSAVYALACPKPLHIQMGRQDGLWVGSGPAAPQSWFSGTKRGALSDETIGAFLQLQSIWQKAGFPISLHQHSGGHEDVDSAALAAFLKSVLP